MATNGETAADRWKCGRRLDRGLDSVQRDGDDLVSSKEGKGVFLLKIRKKRKRGTHKRVSLSHQTALAVIGCAGLLCFPHNILLSKFLTKPHHEVPFNPSHCNLH